MRLICLMLFVLSCNVLMAQDTIRSCSYKDGPKKGSDKVCRVEGKAYTGVFIEMFCDGFNRPLHPYKVYTYKSGKLVDGVSYGSITLPVYDGNADNVGGYEKIYFVEFRWFYNNGELVKHEKYDQWGKLVTTQPYH